ncbi:MAG: hypothetical protein EKK61_01150 [Rickettsiales bacterium]|nr:MAG: hypothetical protein EKK61_01150 [Rickettsiales bacterium]
MNHIITIGKYKIPLFPLIFTTIGVIIMIALGSWQLRRLDQKNNFIKTVEQNITSPAKSLYQIATDNILYSKISLSGQFIPNKNIFLYGRRTSSPEKDGYYILSAFQAIDGKTYLVSRGWMPQSVKNEFVDSESSHTIIETIALPGERKAFMVPKNDRNKNIWFTIDLNMAHEVLGVTENNFYLMQINSDSLPKGAKPLLTNHLNKVRNDHFEYAITWYSLAFSLFVMFMIYCRKYNKTVD